MKIHNNFIKKRNTNQIDKKSKMKSISIINNYYTMEKLPILTKNNTINNLKYNQKNDIKVNKSKKRNK